MRIEQTTELDGKPRPEFDLTMWVDDDGQVLKSTTKSFGGLVTYRTTESAATAPIRAAEKLNMVLETVIKVTHKIDKPEESRQILYRVTLKDDKPAEVFPTDRRQTLRAEANKPSVLLEVKTAGPDQGTAGPESVGDEYLRPNAFITSEDATIRQLAAKAVGSTLDPVAARSSGRKMGRSKCQREELRDRVCTGERGGPDTFGRLHRA